MGVDIGKERLPVRDLRRLRWRKEGDREECAALPQLARAPAGERHLDLAANASGPSIEKADAIRAVFGQPAFRVSGDDQARDDKDSHAAEPAGVEIVLERRVGVVELALEHLSDVHDRDVRAAAVLQELGVHHTAVVIHHERRLLIFAQHDIGGVAEQRSVEPPGIDQRAADDRVRRVVVFRPERLIEVDGVDPRVPSPCGQDRSALRLCEMCPEEHRPDHGALSPTHADHWSPFFREAWLTITRAVVCLAHAFSGPAAGCAIGRVRSPAGSWRRTHAGRPCRGATRSRA